MASAASAVKSWVGCIRDWFGSNSRSGLQHGSTGSAHRDDRHGVKLERKISPTLPDSPTLLGDSRLDPEESTLIPGRSPSPNLQRADGNGRAGRRAANGTSTQSGASSTNFGGVNLLNNACEREELDLLLVEYSSKLPPCRDLREALAILEDDEIRLDGLFEALRLFFHAHVYAEEAFQRAGSEETWIHKDAMQHYNLFKLFIDLDGRPIDEILYRDRKRKTYDASALPRSGTLNTSLSEAIKEEPVTPISQLESGSLQRSYSSIESRYPNETKESQLGEESQPTAAVDSVDSALSAETSATGPQTNPNGVHSDEAWPRAEFPRYLWRRCQALVATKACVALLRVARDVYIRELRVVRDYRRFWRDHCQSTWFNQVRGLTQVAHGHLAALGRIELELVNECGRIHGQAHHLGNLTWFAYSSFTDGEFFDCFRSAIRTWQIAEGLNPGDGVEKGPLYEDESETEDDDSENVTSQTEWAEGVSFKASSITRQQSGVSQENLSPGPQGVTLQYLASSAPFTAYKYAECTTAENEDETRSLASELVGSAHPGGSRENRRLGSVHGADSEPRQSTTKTTTKKLPHVLRRIHQLIRNSALLPALIRSAPGLYDPETSPLHALPEEIETFHNFASFWIQPAVATVAHDLTVPDVVPVTSQEEEQRRSKMDSEPMSESADVAMSSDSNEGATDDTCSNGRFMAQLNRARDALSLMLRRERSISSVSSLNSSLPLSPSPSRSQQTGTECHTSFKSCATCAESEHAEVVRTLLVTEALQHPDSLSERLPDVMKTLMIAMLRAQPKSPDASILPQQSPRAEAEQSDYSKSGQPNDPSMDEETQRRNEVAKTLYDLILTELGLSGHPLETCVYVAAIASLLPLQERAFSLIIAPYIPPSHFRRNAMFYGLGALVLLGVAYNGYRYRDVLTQHWKGIRESAEFFVHEHVVEPLEKIYVRIFSAFHKDKLPTSDLPTRAELAQSRQELKQMLLEYGREYVDVLSAAEGVSKPQFLETLPERAAKRDMSLVMHKYTNDVVHPMRNINSLVSGLLIQIQKLKADTEESMLDLDQILEQNEINFNMFATFPAIIMVGGAAYALDTLRRYAMSKSTSYRDCVQEMRVVLQKIEMLLIQVSAHALSRQSTVTIANPMQYASSVPPYTAANMAIAPPSYYSSSGSSVFASQRGLHPESHYPEMLEEGGLDSSRGSLATALSSSTYVLNGPYSYLPIRDRDPSYHENMPRESPNLPPTLLSPGIVTEPKHGPASTAQMRASVAALNAAAAALGQRFTPQRQQRGPEAAPALGSVLLRSQPTQHVAIPPIDLGQSSESTIHGVVGTGAATRAPAPAPAPVIIGSHLFPIPPKKPQEKPVPSLVRLPTRERSIVRLNSDLGLSTDRDVMGVQNEAPFESGSKDPSTPGKSLSASRHLRNLTQVLPVVPPTPSTPSGPGSPSLSGYSLSQVRDSPRGFLPHPSELPSIPGITVPPNRSPSSIRPTDAEAKVCGDIDDSQSLLTPNLGHIRIAQPLARDKGGPLSRTELVTDQQTMIIQQQQHMLDLLQQQQQQIAYLLESQNRMPAQAEHQPQLFLNDRETGYLLLYVFLLEELLSRLPRSTADRGAVRPILMCLAGLKSCELDVAHKLRIVEHMYRAYAIFTFK